MSRRNSKKSYEFIALDTEYQDPELFHPSSPKPESPKDPFSPPQNAGAVYEIVEDFPHRQKSPAPGDRPPALFPRAIRILNTQEDGQSSSSNGTRPKTHPYTSKTNIPPKPSPASRTICDKATHTLPPVVPPPPLPKKKGVTMTLSGHHDFNQRYDSLRRPASISEWLSGINLQEHVDKFLKNGFDSMNFVTNMDTDDLEHIGVNKAEHRKRILSSLGEMDC